MIEVGVSSGLFRPRWDDVIRLLRVSNDGPVVTSYSVCESFPERDYTFDEGMAELRDREERDLEIRPKGFADFRFSHNLSAFDLVQEVIT